jgi:hypothetical protein
MTALSAPGRPWRRGGAAERRRLLPPLSDAGAVHVAARASSLACLVTMVVALSARLERERRRSHAI